MNASQQSVFNNLKSKILIFLINAFHFRSVETYLLDQTGSGFQVDRFFESVGVFIGVFSGSFFLGFLMGLVTALVSFGKYSLIFFYIKYRIFFVDYS